MKIKEVLLEMPYHHPGSMKKPDFTTSFTSSSSLERLYEKMLCEKHASVGTDVKFFLNKAHSKVIGVVDGVKPKTNEKTNQIIFSLQFKDKHTLVKIPNEFGTKKILQVNSVSIHGDYEGEGIASFVYASLVAAGYLVLSDTSQFDDGKMLWKKMAREAHAESYTIFVLDDEYGFQVDKSGVPIRYDAKNIDDAKIWTAGLDQSGEHILLAMK